eukprot:TRINITY_DN3383_c0_g1_i10.p3 TRINITY_DN3383_c0_g1~~TRINITY_DN3383_c0_g1_i10.p3  ORF type:complete len:318 (-),score=26.40 TRINITY_DN3383_c0_g1_i10:953-1810(-)
MIIKFLLFLIFLRKNEAGKDVLSRQGQVVENLGVAQSIETRTLLIMSETNDIEETTSDMDGSEAQIAEVENDPAEVENVGTPPGGVVYGTRRLAMFDAEREAPEPAELEEVEPVEREAGTPPATARGGSRCVVVYGTRRLAMFDAEREAPEPAELGLDSLQKNRERQNKLVVRGGIPLGNIYYLTDRNVVTPQVQQLFMHRQQDDLLESDSASFEDFVQYFTQLFCEFRRYISLHQDTKKKNQRTPIQNGLHIMPKAVTKSYKLSVIVCGIGHSRIWNLHVQNLA